MTKPLLLILYGPPGSGKSFLLNKVREYIDIPNDFISLKSGTFVYNNPEYKDELATLNNPSVKVLQNLYDKYSWNSYKLFQQTIGEALVQKKNVILEVAGRNVEWLRQYIKLLKTSNYEIKILYPYLTSFGELSERIKSRKNQTPLPLDYAEIVFKGANKRFKELVEMYSQFITDIYVMDNSQKSPISGRFIFVYNYRKHECNFMDIRFKCSLLSR